MVPGDSVWRPPQYDVRVVRPEVKWLSEVSAVATTICKGLSALLTYH